MKVIVFTDVHITPIKGWSLFEDTALNCMNAIMDYAEKNNIDTLWNLGDTFYRKEYVESYLIPKSLPTFKRLRKFNTKFIVGNHDIAIDKDDQEHNLLEIFQDYIDIVENPYESIEIDGNNFVFINYINNHLLNEEKLTKEKKKNILLGHFDINGFYTNAKHQMDTADLNTDDLNMWDLVFSGHYHKRSKYDNIQYIGSTHHMRRLDVSNPFGFMVFDTKTLEYSFKKYTKYSPPCFYEFNLKDIDRIKKTKNGFIRIFITTEQAQSISNSDLESLRKYLLDKGNHHVLFDVKREKSVEFEDAGDVSLDFPTDNRGFFEAYVSKTKTELDKKRLVDIITKD